MAISEDLLVVGFSRCHKQLACGMVNLPLLYGPRWVKAWLIHPKVAPLRNEQAQQWPPGVYRHVSLSLYIHIYIHTHFNLQILHTIKHIYSNTIKPRHMCIYIFFLKYLCLYICSCMEKLSHIAGITWWGAGPERGTGHDTWDQPENRMISTKHIIFSIFISLKEESNRYISIYIYRYLLIIQSIYIGICIYIIYS